MITNLSDLKPGDRGVIVEINTKSSYKLRLASMGILLGEEVLVLKIAPLGDPISIKIKGYELALRKREASCIKIESNRESAKELPTTKV
ncbi:MAG: FeoA family protein [Nitrospinota bacterium]